MKRLALTALLIANMSILFAQSKYSATDPTVILEGTSTFHDWHMKSAEGSCNAVFNFTGTTLTSLSSLLFTVQAETLKSGTGGLNKNAYKALNTEKYPNITFSSNYANIRLESENNYVVSAKGRLTISSVSRDVWIAIVCKVDPADMSITASGSYKLKMSDYNVTPPSFMFGAMKTGDEVTIKFSGSMKK